MDTPCQWGEAGVSSGRYVALEESYSSVRAERDR